MYQENALKRKIWFRILHSNKHVLKTPGDDLYFDQ